MILTLPNGSAIDAQYIAAITWDKARQGGTPAVVRIYSPRDNSFGLGFSRTPQMEQIHCLAMESDADAERVCRELTDAWTGKALQPPATV